MIFRELKLFSRKPNPAERERNIARAELELVLRELRMGFCGIRLKPWKAEAR